MMLELISTFTAWLNTIKWYVGWANTPSDESYWYMMAEQRPKQDNIDDAAYDEYIGAEAIMDIPGELPMSVIVRHHVEDLDGAKVVTYYRNPLTDTKQHELQYYDGIHDRYFS